MSVLRRNFMKTSAMAAMAAGLLSKAPLIAFGQNSTKSGSQTEYFQMPYEAKTEKTFYFTQATFEPYVNTDFKVHASRVTATLRLIDVEACEAEAPKGAGECFALTFKADRELSIVQTIHPFEHDALGEFKLFVSPLRKVNDADGIYYVAVINHRTQSTRSNTTIKPRLKSRSKSRL